MLGALEPEIQLVVTRQDFGERVEADEDEIKQALSGILCRCGSYKKIIEAIESVKK